jgi:predicted alpha-1,2-mannosidase
MVRCNWKTLKPVVGVVLLLSVAFAVDSHYQMKQNELKAGYEQRLQDLRQRLRLAEERALSHSTSTDTTTPSDLPSSSSTTPSTSATSASTSAPLPPHCRNGSAYVNVLIGTDTSDSLSNGNTLPLVARPFGFNHWSVFTTPNTAWFFHPNAPTTYGIRCTHQPSPWLGDWGNFVVAGWEDPSAYSSRDSTFNPYRVKLTAKTKGGPVEMEFTPSVHGAAFAFRFAANSPRAVVLLVSDGEIDQAKGEVRAKTWEKSDRLPQDFALHIFGQSSQPPSSSHVSQSHGYHAKKLVLGFDPVDHVSEIEFRLGTSLISAEFAKANLESELGFGQLSFNALIDQGKEEWDTLMARVCPTDFVGTSKEIWYSNFYRSLLFPRFLDETDPSSKQTVHWSPYTGRKHEGTMVTDSGFWDAYSTVYPWLSMSFTDILSPMLTGWVNSYKEAGWLPTWASPNQRGSMVGTLGDATLADAIAKNISGFDRALALEAMLKDATVEGRDGFGRKCLGEYINLGFVTTQCEHRDSAGRSLYYYTSDAAIAKAAEIMGNKEMAGTLAQRAGNYFKLFDKSAGFFVPRQSADRFLQGFDSRRWEAGFTEGSAEQFRFNVPFDVAGLNRLMDGKLCDNVNRLLTLGGPAYTTSGMHYHEMVETERIQKHVGLLGHSNQPSHHVLYVALKGGCNGVADRFIRTVISKLYSLEGWSGDEDNGEMAAWYLLSTLGLYFLDLGTDDVILGTPAVTRASMMVFDQQTRQTNELIIEALDNSEQNVYVQHIKWRGDILPTRNISYTKLTKGGTLSFQMGANPMQ